MNRRQFLQNTLLSYLAYTCSAQCSAHAHHAKHGSKGCTFGAFSAVREEIKLVDSTGNMKLDRAYGREKRLLTRAFQVRPGAGFFDDYMGPNAFATPERFFTDGPDGTVLFGVRLLDRELGRKADDAVISIMAHEFAHIVQFSQGIEGDSNVLLELHADYLAGWYLARRSKREWVDLSLPIKSLFANTEYEYSNPSHGLPAQRKAALLAGFRNGGLSLRDAYNAGLDAAGL